MKKEMDNSQITSIETNRITVQDHFSTVLQADKHAKIKMIETIIVDLPTIRPHHLSMTVMRNQTMVIIRIMCSDGIEGIGEALSLIHI
jgi:hypothetical protein